MGRHVLYLSKTSHLTIPFSHPASSTVFQFYTTRSLVYFVTSQLHNDFVMYFRFFLFSACVLYSKITHFSFMLSHKSSLPLPIAYQTHISLYDAPFSVSKSHCASQFHDYDTIHFILGEEKGTKDSKRHMCKCSPTSCCRIRPNIRCQSDLATQKTPLNVG